MSPTNRVLARVSGQHRRGPASLRFLLTGHDSEATDEDNAMTYIVNGTLHGVEEVEPGVLHR